MSSNHLQEAATGKKVRMLPSLGDFGDADDMTMKFPYRLLGSAAALN